MESGETHLAAYVDQTPIPRVAPGGLAVVRLRLRNIGSATWSRDGSHPTLLATDRPLDRASPRRVPELWVSENRMARVSERIVRPGGLGTFEVALRAPIAPGLYVESVRPVADGRTWFNDLELFLALEVVVPAALDEHGLAAELLEPVPPLLLRSGELAQARLRVRNVGRVRWVDRVGEYGPLVQLGTDEPREHEGLFLADGWLGPNRAARVPGIVLPGQAVDLGFPIVAPAAPGAYAERYRLVAEGVTWFDAMPAVEVRILVI